MSVLAIENKRDRVQERMRHRQQQASTQYSVGSLKPLDKLQADTSESTWELAFRKMGYPIGRLDQVSEIPSIRSLGC